MDNSNKIYIYVAELIHDTSGKFLDIKGSIADKIKGEKIFNDWQISSDNIRFFNQDSLPRKREEAYATPNLLRYIVYNPDTDSYFKDKTQKFFKSIIDKKSNLYSIPELRRIGIRTKCYIKSDLDFKKIYETIYCKFFKDDLDKLVGKNRKDLRVVFTLSEDDFDISFTIGPLNKNEIQKHLGVSENALGTTFDKTGIYIDIDCARTKNINPNNITEIIKSALSLTHDKINTLIKNI